MCSIVPKVTILALIVTGVVYFLFSKEIIAYMDGVSLLKTMQGSVQASPFSLENTFESVGPLNSEFVTVISVYFAFNKSKHGLSDYEVWTKNMALSVSNAPLVLFTDPQSYPKFKEWRKNSTLRTTYYVYDDVWVLMREQI